MKLEEHPNIYVRFFMKDRMLKERPVLWTYKRMIKKTREEFKKGKNINV